MEQWQQREKEKEEFILQRKDNINEEARRIVQIVIGTLEEKMEQLSQSDVEQITQNNLDIAILDERTIELDKIMNKRVNYLNNTRYWVVLNL